MRDSWDKYQMKNTELTRIIIKKHILLGIKI